MGHIWPPFGVAGNVIGAAPRIERGRAIALAALLVTAVLVVLAGINGARIGDLGETAGGSEADAVRLVERWFDEASTGTGDRGWSMLYPTTREGVIGAQSTYRDMVDRADWAGIDFVVTGARTHDGKYHVDVRLVGGRDMAPAFMLDWGLIQFPPIDGATTDRGLIQVRMDPFWGPAGILGG